MLYDHMLHMTFPGTSDIMTMPETSKYFFINIVSVEFEGNKILFKRSYDKQNFTLAKDSFKGLQIRMHN